MKSRLWKILRWAAIVVAALLVVVAVVFYWLARRAWPEVDGKLAVPGLAAPVEIVRVEPGVPHLYAQSAHDLFFAQGYVHAQDRLWQMELNLYVGRGELGALFGEAAVDLDKVMRIFGIARAAEADWKILSPDTRAALTAYADGVNAYLDSHRGRLPIEFTILGVEPRRWTPVDSLAWGKLMALNLSLNYSFEILRTHLIGKLGAEAAQRLLSPYPASDPVIVPPALRAFADLPVRRPPRTELAALPSFSRLSGAGAPPWGSNGWVVAGSRTASGRPILANDTHLGLQMPSVWYQVGLHGGGYDEVGFSFPGMPYVVLGHNRRIAWGITNLCADVEDFYLEKLDDPAHPRRYLFQGAWRDLTLRREEIAVKGKPNVVLEVRETHHGPILNDAIPELKGSPPMALRWPALGGTKLIDALAALNRASDWASFHRALADWDTPAVNFVYADVDGHIAYQSTARTPIRAKGHQGLVPVPGWDGLSEWQGFIPYEEMPKLVDPPSGFIVTANNKVVGDDYPYFLAYDMADPYRARYLTKLLSAGKGFTREGMRKIQAETQGLPAAEIRPWLLAVPPAGDRSGRERKALDLVRSWDLRYEPESVGASIYEVWYWYFLGDTLGDELGKDVLVEYRTVGLSQVPSILDLLKRPDDPLFDDKRTPAVEHRDDIVRRSLTRAVTLLAKRYGDDPSGWTYGRVHSVKMVHSPLGASGIAPLEALFNSKTFPARGTSFTVDAAAADMIHPFAVNFGTSQRMIVDLADLEASTWVNSTGQDAQLFHPHREDQIPKWEAIEGYPMTFGEAAVKAHPEAHLTLVPKAPKR